jgi:hypothetical protein
MQTGKLAQSFVAMRPSVARSRFAAEIYAKRAINSNHRLQPLYYYKQIRLAGAKITLGTYP